MPITVRTLDGLDDLIEAGPGTCKEALIERGVALHPPDTFHVAFEGRAVDDEPLARFEGQFLYIVPVGPIPPPPVKRFEPPVQAGRVLVLRGPSGQLEIRIETGISSRVMLRLVPPDEARFVDPHLQFSVLPVEGAGWMIRPAPRCLNRTMVNGKECVRPQLLRTGDRVGVGNPATGVVRAAMEVTIRDDAG